MPLLFVHPTNFISSLSPALTEPVGAFCYPQRERKESPILKEHQAEALYNLVVIFYDNHFKDTYNPAWDDFFKEANGS